MFESQVARRESSVVSDSAPAPGEKGEAAGSAGPTLEAAARLGHRLGGYGLAHPLVSPIQLVKRKRGSGSDSDSDSEDEAGSQKKKKPNEDDQDDTDLGVSGGPPVPSPFLSRASSMPMPVSGSPFSGFPSAASPFSGPPSPPPQGLGRSLSFGFGRPSPPQAPLLPFQGPPSPSPPPPDPTLSPPPTVVPPSLGSPGPPPVSPPQALVSSPPSAVATSPPAVSPWIPPGSEPMLRPARPTFRNKDVNQPADPGLVQPITTVVPSPVEPGPLLSGRDLDERLAEIPDGAPRVPIAEPVDKLRQFTGASAKVKNMGVKLTGGNQGGLYPEDDAQVQDLPESADYTASRPQQLLSQLGEVFLHHGNKAEVNPVEVQFGYGQKADGSVDLYSSTNNKKSQEWLLEALKTPVAHLKAAAKNTDDPNVARVAQKVLFFKEQNAKRREQIKGLPNEAELEKQLQLAEKIHSSFFNDPVHVATNDADRHAEQNIGDVMHDKGYISGDIQGPKIRCEGCSSELGQNLQDSSGTKLIGRVYASQADPEKHRATFGGIRAGRTKVVTNRTERSRSSSPVRARPKPKPAPGSSPLGGPAVAMAGPPPPPVSTRPQRRKPENDDTTMSVPSSAQSLPSPSPPFLFAPPPPGPPMPLPGSFPPQAYPPPPPPATGATQLPPSPQGPSRTSSSFDALFDD